MRFVRDLTQKSAPSELQNVRGSILEMCCDAGNGDRGLYNLTVPTGGGKTLASLAFAVTHASKRKMERIIYVAPYTSIIDQTAKTYIEVLGEDMVLEHHDGVEYDDEHVLHRHATENWDMPVIVTTAVQFFESLYANKPGRCRKLHNIANSVVNFDEVQTLPEVHLKACVYGIAELVRHYGVTAVMMTATQPALDELFAQSPLRAVPAEICPEDSIDATVFCRSRVVYDGDLDEETLASELALQEQVLCIVNRRRTAQDLFEQLSGLSAADESFHLSTLMTPTHRTEVLDEIRRRLQTGQPCRVVATNLIEAGVDVDFPAAYRKEAALESIVQSAVRCNREGRRPTAESIVHVFRLKEPVPAMQRQTALAQEIMKQYPDCTSREAIHSYYCKGRETAGPKALDVAETAVLTREESEQKFAYETIAERFHMLDDATKPVYVPCEKNESLIRRLRDGERSRELFRALDRYQMPLYEHELRELENASFIEMVDGRFGILLTENDPGLCSEKVGLDAPKTEFDIAINL